MAGILERQISYRLETFFDSLYVRKQIYQHVIGGALSSTTTLYMKGRSDLISPQDLKYVSVDPDPNFDPLQNMAVIEKTIKDNEKLVKARNKEAVDGVKERINATAVYLRSINQGGKSTDREKFFGKKYLAYLRGKEVMSNIKQQMMLQGRDGKAFVIKAKGVV